MKKQTKKRGFTIVELVIVMAVIAILAAVLVPTFSNIIKKANISADTQLVRNMNMALAADEAMNGKPEGMSQVETILEEAGYIVANLNPTTEGYYYAWDSVQNKIFFLTDTFEQHYPAASDLAMSDKNNLWIGASTAEEAQTLANGGFSLYFESNIDGNITINKWVGVDTGIYKMNGNLSIIENTSSKATIGIKGTFNNTVEVENSNGTVEQNGYIYTLKVNAIDTACFNVNGQIGVIEEVTAGTVVNKGIISTVNIDNIASAGKVINYGSISSVKGTVTQTNLYTTAEPTSSNGVIENIGYVSQVNNSTYVPKTVSGESTTQKSALYENGTTFYVSTASELQNIAFMVNNGLINTLNVELSADINLANIPWVPIGTKDHPFNGTFNGNNYVISNLSNNNKTASDLELEYRSFSSGGTGGAYGLLGYVKNSTIKDVTLTDVAILGDSFALVGSIVGVSSGDLTMTNCTVSSGSINVLKKTGGLIGMVEGYTKAGDDVIRTVLIDKCSNSANVTTTNDRASGLIGDMPLKSGSSNVTVTISNCSNAGSVTGAKWVSAICSHIYNGQEAIVNISNCVNTGTLTSTDGNTGLLGRAANLQKNNAANAEYGCRITVSNCDNNGTAVTKENCWAVLDDGVIGDSWYDAVNGGVADFIVTHD